MQAIFDWLSDLEQENRPQRPLVTVTYAQSIDGSLTIHRGLPTALSGPETKQLTHQLRAWHDAILVGIETVLADDPELTVRYSSGANPRPIVLDSHLRIPEGCRLLQRKENLPWLATCGPADADRRARLSGQGARVLDVPCDADGRVNLRVLLNMLYALGVRRLMVEGGAQVISAFLRQRLADCLIVTIAPLLLGGLNALQEPMILQASGQTVPVLQSPSYLQMGTDMVVWGKLGERGL